MKRRALRTALACAMLLSLLAACGPKGSGSRPGGSSAPGASSSMPGGSQGGAATVPDGSQPGGSQGGIVTMPDPDDAPMLTLNRYGLPLFEAGATYQLEASTEPAMDGAKAEFSSDDESVATVSDTGLVTAVGPGQTGITVRMAGAEAMCAVLCDWGTDDPGDAVPDGAVDLKAFAQRVMTDHDLGILERFDEDVTEGLYPGLSGIAAGQRLVYGTMMSMNTGELVLVQVDDAKDVSAVEDVLKARIDYMVESGAWYPEPTELWKNDSLVTSHGNYVMLVVNEDCDAIAAEFEALF